MWSGSLKMVRRDKALCVTISTNQQSMTTLQCVQCPHTHTHTHTKKITTLQSLYLIQIASQQASLNWSLYRPTLFMPVKNSILISWHEVLISKVAQNLKRTVWIKMLLSVLITGKLESTVNHHHLQQQQNQICTRAPNVLSFKGVPSPLPRLFRQYFHPLFINLDPITACSKVLNFHKTWV